MTRSAMRGIGLLLAGTGAACAVIGGGMWLAQRIAPTLEGVSGPSVETLFTALVYLPLVLIAAVVARAEGFRALALGNAPWRGFALGVAIGSAGLCAAVADASLAGSLVPGPADLAGPVLVVWGAAVILFQAAAEEIFFRGWLQRALARRWGGVAAVVAAASAFSLAHLAGGVRTPLSLVNLLLGGLLFGLLAWRVGGLATAIGAHWSWNAAEQLGFGIDPNTGVGSFGALFDHELVGPTTWGGSSEGLNASLPMTMVLVAILATVVVGQWKAGRASVRPATSRARYRSDPAP